jgi:hypothetical protein
MEEPKMNGEEKPLWHENRITCSCASSIRFERFASIVGTFRHDHQKGQRGAKHGHQGIAKPAISHEHHSPHRLLTTRRI